MKCVKIVRGGMIIVLILVLNVTSNQLARSFIIKNPSTFIFSSFSSSVLILSFPVYAFTGNVDYIVYAVRV